MNGGFQSIGTGWASEPWNSASSYTAIESVRDARAYFSMETTTAQTASLSMALGVYRHLKAALKIVSAKRQTSSLLS